VSLPACLHQYTLILSFCTPFVLPLDHYGIVQASWIRR
jgi:hypothetical protein